MKEFKKKFKEGIWVLALDINQQVIGCLAVVPAKIQIDVPQANPQEGVNIPSGIPFYEWGINKIRETKRYRKIKTLL